MAIDVGEMRIWPTNAPPAQWLLCQGQTVAQATYPALFALIGAAFNTGGEPPGTFRLPDLRGRIHATVGTLVALAASDGLAEAARDPQSHQMLGGMTGMTNSNFIAGPHLLGATDQEIQGPIMGVAGGPAGVAGSTHGHGPGTLNPHTGADSDHYHLQGASAARTVWPPFLGLNYMVFAGV